MRLRNKVDSMTDEKVKILLKEIVDEQQISPFIKTDGLLNYIKEGIYDINYNAGKEIDYDKDLKARSLLKNYVLYARHKRLAEFKELYYSDYATLQAEYY